MFDHVGVANSDLAASEQFYRAVLSALDAEPSYAGADMVGWDDWWIGPTDREHPVTCGLHVGFRARDRTQVDAFWQAGIEARYRGDGTPGPRTQYGLNYYGAFLRDPDGNGVEAVHDDREDAVTPRLHRPPVDPRPRSAGLPAVLRDDPARRAARDAR